MINLIGIVYEVDTMNELNTMPTYVPPNSKAYYYCKENNNLYERNFNGAYSITKDFDRIIQSQNKNKEEVKQIEQNNNDINIKNHENDFEKTTNYLAQHIMSLRYKIDSVIKMINPNMLPSDIHTKYNPDLIQEGENNVKQHNENDEQQLTK